jgi:hypothetical protein
VAIGLSAKSLPSPHDEFVSHLLPDHWQPPPQHLAVIGTRSIFFFFVFFLLLLLLLLLFPPFFFYSANLCLVINGNNIPTVIETEFKMYSKPFLTLAPLKAEKEIEASANNAPIPSSSLTSIPSFRTAVVTGVYPFWGETFRYYDVGLAKEKTNYVVLCTCWSEGAEAIDPLI